MLVKKSFSVDAYTTDEKKMVPGNRYVFKASEGKCYAGIFVGFTNKGALRFASVLNDFLVHFNIMPASVLSIYEAEIEVKGDK